MSRTSFLAFIAASIVLSSGATVVPVRRTVFSAEAAASSHSDGQTVHVKAVNKGVADALLVSVKAKKPSLKRRSHRNGWWGHHCHNYPGCDEGHSWHWNYRNGYTNCDGPYWGPYYKRDLNKRDGNFELANTHKTNYKNNQDMHKSMVRKPKGHGKHRSSGKKHMSYEKGAPVGADDAKDGASVSASLGLHKRHSHRHSHQHDHEHYHGHEHSHGHWRDSHWRRAEEGAEDAETEDSAEASADLDPAGIPGFIAVASAIDHSTFAKPSGGLVYSANPNGDNTSFTLGTAPDDGNQFNLVPVNPTDTASAVEIHVPILNAKTMQTSDYCATFDVVPPSALTLMSCEEHTGKSQSFAWNSKTGELVPVYTKSQKDTALTTIKTQTLAAIDDSGAEEDADSSNAVADDSEADLSSVEGDDGQDATKTSDAAEAQNSPQALKSGPSLFFVPASSYYSSSNSTLASNSTSPLSASAVSSSATPTAHINMLQMNAELSSIFSGIPSAVASAF